MRLIVPHVRLIHSVASESAMRELERHRDQARRGPEDPDRGGPRRGVLARRGCAPAELDGLIARSPFPVAGLMTMPPLSSDPEDSRPWFAAPAGAGRRARRSEHLSMGTSQDYLVAVEEGATIVRIGTSLYR